MKIKTVYKFDMSEEEIESLENVKALCESLPDDEYSKLPKYLKQVISDLYTGVGTLLSEIEEE